jgi:hypothetical protein
VHPQLIIRTTEQDDRRVLSEWYTAGRRGEILTDPPTGLDRRVIGELLALHAITDLVRPLRIKDRISGACIGVSMPEILDAIAAEPGTEKFRPYARFIDLALLDLRFEVVAHNDWPEMDNSIHCESFVLVDNAPWEDQIHLAKGVIVCPTRRAVADVMGLLNTRRQWKAWAALYQQARDAVSIPARILDIDAETIAVILPGRGWLLLTKHGRVVAATTVRPHEMPALFSYFMGVPGMEFDGVVTRISLAALEQATSDTQRLQVLFSTLDALPTSARTLFGEESAPDRKSIIGLLLDACYRSALSPECRTQALRRVLSAIPFNEANITLPDQSTATITSHVIERLLTRFNVRSVLKVIEMLHKSAPHLHQVHLPPFVEAMKALKYASIGTHWRMRKNWTLVVSAQTILTAYFPRTE